MSHESLQSDGAEAIVLRTVPWRDHDLIVDLLTLDHGQMTLVARGARRSTRRFGGALDQGTRIRMEISASRKGRASLTSCDVLMPIRTARQDLGRITHLNYVLELARIGAQPESADPELFSMLVQYLDALEQAPASMEGLVAWELRLLAHLGYQLYLARCVGTGGMPNGLSLSSGGAVDARVCPATDVVRVPTPGLKTLWQLSEGDVSARFAPAHVPAVRRALDAIWTSVAGRPLRTASFLVGW
jgi:DNA repair protein RecO (recombination protein O)